MEEKSPNGVTMDTNCNFYICYRNSKEIVIWNKHMTSSRVTTRQYSQAPRYDSFRNQLNVSFQNANEVECYQLQ